MAIFVAGPYSAPTEDQIGEHVRRACEAGQALLDRGHYPMIPHLTVAFSLWRQEHRGEDLPYETYLDWSMALLRRCDGVLSVGRSPGADREVALARKIGLPVWERIDDVPFGAGKGS